VPAPLLCDELAARPFEPGEYVKTQQIDAANAVTACNEALRNFPLAARLHVQYARALIASGRPNDALRAIEDHVEIGYASAKHVMAELYLDGGLGEDGDANYLEAEKWFLEAAEQGDFIAQMDLYRLYLDGASGVRRNSVEAIRWLTAASDLQYSPATFLLAEHYERGQGVSRDYDRAAELYERLVVEDHVQAILALADLYERGRGVARDRQRALSLFVKARELGDESVDKRIERLEKSL